jgi:hypothetical protein
VGLPGRWKRKRKGRGKKWGIRKNNRRGERDQNTLGTCMKIS